MIEKARDELLNHMMSMNKNDMSVEELKIYAETLRIVSEVQLKNHADVLMEIIRNNTYMSGVGTLPKEGELS